MNITGEFVDFMESYAAFFEEMTVSEQDKLEAMLSNDIKMLEHSVSAQQASAKRLENIEKKRIDMQEKANCTGMSLGQIIEAAPPEYTARLGEVSQRINRAVEEIKFYNDKSMGVVKMNLQAINTALPQSPELQGYTPARGQAGEYKSTSTFETKI